MSGVYPCYENQFTIDVTGGDGSTASNNKSIADMESFTVSIDGNVEEWNPYDTEGWTRRLVTGKAITISVSGKRNVGDAGNDYIESIATKTGADCSTTLTWNFPSGAVLVMPCVVNVTEWGAGDSRSVAPLAFDAMSDGKASFLPALSDLTVAATAGTSATGDTKVTVTALNQGDTLAYKKNPSGIPNGSTTSTAYSGTSMTSGTASTISSCVSGDVIEVVEFNASGKAVASGRITLTPAMIKS